MRCHVCNDGYLPRGPAGQCKLCKLPTCPRCLWPGLDGTCPNCLVARAAAEEAKMDEEAKR